MSGPMLARAARRSVLAGGKGERRHCSCLECAVTETKSAQRQHERRAWQREASE